MAGAGGAALRFRSEILAVVLRLAAAIAAVSLPLAATSQDAERRVMVATQVDGKPQVFEDSISEYEVVSYVVPLKEGQTLQAVLASSNAANCFDIHAPGAAKPFFVGAESGNSHRLTAASSGNYVIRVFLLRFAARDGQTARFALELTIAT